MNDEVLVMSADMEPGRDPYPGPDPGLTVNEPATDRYYGDIEAAPIQPESTKRSINIEQLDYGYVVRVGCQTVAVETPEKLTEKLLEYLKEPARSEVKWRNGEFM